MRGNTEEKTLRQRLSAGKLTQADVVRRLGDLAFGRANDCVRLVLEEGADLKELNLSLLAEVRRSEKGAVEVKLCDRLQALEQLTALVQESSGDLGDFLDALRGGGEQ